jgi:hypothetical protein
MRPAGQHLSVLPPAAGVGQGHEELVEQDGKMVYMQVGQENLIT